MRLIGSTILYRLNDVDAVKSKCPVIFLQYIRQSILEVKMLKLSWGRNGQAIDEINKLRARRRALKALFFANLGAPIYSHAAPVNLTWAHVFETSEHYHQQAVSACAAIEEATNGRVAITVIPASRAGNEEQYSSKLKSGEIDIAYIAMTHAAKDYAGLAVGGFPFIFRDSDHVRRYLGSDFFANQLKSYNLVTGNHMISAVYYGARHVTSNKRISSPEDMVGLKLREPGAPAYLLFGKSMKAEVISIPFSKLYDALKSGVVEAEENPLSTIKAKRLYEVQKYALLTAHIHDLISITISGKAWQAISPADQIIVSAILRKSAFWTSVFTVSKDLVVEQELSKFGMHVNTADRNAFREFSMKNINISELGVSNEEFKQVEALIDHVPV